MYCYYRRYADVIVHRLLEASFGANHEPFTLEEDDVDAIAGTGIIIYCRSEQIQS